MSLDQRLERAREDYRALEVPDAPVRTGWTDRPGPRARRPRAWLVAAAVLALAGVAGVLLVVGTRDGGDGGKVEVAGPPTTSTAVPGDAEVTLDPAGPYRAGQEVTLQVPADLQVDLANGPAVCSEVATAGGTVESCDPTADLVVLGTSTATSVTVRLPRTVFTPVGERDCAVEGVTCRLVITAGDRTRYRSDRLAFTGEPPAPTATLAVEAAGEPGTFTLRPRRLAADSSWLDFRAAYPDRLDGIGALGVRLCAFGASLGGTEGPFGDDLWDQDPAGPGEVTCDADATAISIDPDDPDRAVTATLPTVLHGYRGWADCRVDRCFLDVRRTIVTSVDPEGPFEGYDVSAATALLPGDASWPDQPQPTLTVETPGPHRAGDAVTVTVAGLPAGEETVVGFCSVASPWSCNLGDLVPIGNGPHRLTLPDVPIAGCPPETCYLQLVARGEGLAPLATAPLDTPG